MEYKCQLRCQDYYPRNLYGCNQKFRYILHSNKQLNWEYFWWISSSYSSEKKKQFRFTGSYFQISSLASKLIAFNFMLVSCPGRVSMFAEETIGYLLLSSTSVMKPLKFSRTAPDDCWCECPSTISINPSFRPASGLGSLRSLYHTGSSSGSNPLLAFTNCQTWIETVGLIDFGEDGYQNLL